MKAERFLLPWIDELFDEMSVPKVFTKLYMFSGCWQIQVANYVQEKTAFTCKYGTFQFVVTPFRLMNAPVTFHRMASGLFQGMEYVHFYIDDIIICSQGLEQHIEHTGVACNRIRRAGLKLKLKQFSFAVMKV